MSQPAVSWPWWPWRWGRWKPLLHDKNVAIRREAWGYVFWGFTIVFLFLPAELIPGLGHLNDWPTFSTTVGHLEYLRGWVAILVVLLMVFTGVNAYARKKRHRVSRAKQKRNETAGMYHDDVDGGRLVWHRAAPVHPLAGGRLHALRLLESPSDSRVESEAQVDSAEQPVIWVRMRVYLLGSMAVIGVVAGLGFRFISFWWGSYLLWGAIAVFVIILPSVLAWRYKAHVLFPTLFRTVGNLQDRYQMFGTIVMAFVVILGIHLTLYPWPNISHVLKTASTQDPSISGQAAAGSTVTISGMAENCIRPEGIVVKSKAFANDVTGTVTDGKYSVQARLGSKPAKGDTVTVYCGGPEVGHTQLK